MGQFMRTPVGNIIRKSPFELIAEHASLVEESAKYLSKAFINYLEGNTENFIRIKKEVEEIETKADRIKGNIRNHLPKSILMPVDKTIFLMLLSEEDKTIDNIQDVIEWIYMRNKPPQKGLLEDLHSLFLKVEETLSAYKRAIGNLNDLVESSFSQKEREETKKAVWEVHRLESECDAIERRLTKKLFDKENEVSTGELVHILKLISILGDVADRAENAADRLRAMIAR